MSEIKDGGPAFPRAATFIDATDSPGGDYYEPVDGMSLRDYFAGQALAGICGDGIPGGHHAPKLTAFDAYQYADAMLAAREAK
jgi:hypothetical protein